MKRLVVGACAVAFCALAAADRSDPRSLRAASRSARAADAIRAPAGRSGRDLRPELPHLGFRDRRDHRRHAARLRSLRQEAATFAARRIALDSGRRLGAGRAGARPRGAPARHDHDGRQDRRPSAADERREARAASAARLLRIDVRLRAARRRRAPRAGRGAGDGPSDLARRPPRRSDRRELFGRRSRAGAARHRPARAIHRRDGRHDRPARDRAEDSAVGADAAAVARRAARHEDHAPTAALRRSNSGATATSRALANGSRAAIQRAQLGRCREGRPLSARPASIR